MSVEEAFDVLVATGRFDEVKAAYFQLIAAALEVRPEIKMLGHGYDFPLRMGVPAKLTLEQIGLAALLKRKVGDWIAKNIRHVLPDEDDQRDFVRRLINHFHDHVLVPVRDAHPDVFHFVDFRGILKKEELWNDEMHPSSEGFQLLAVKYRDALRPLLPPAKRDAIG